MRLLVTGAAGFFGHTVCLRHAGRFLLITAWHRRPPEVPGRESFRCELATPEGVERLWELARPEAVLNLAALSRIEDCRDNPEAVATNERAAGHLARLAAADGARFVHVSTDLVFDGSRPPYREGDPPAPLSDYGRTKAASERAVAAAGGRSLVVRAALAYGPAPGGAFRQLDWMLERARAGRPAPLFTDEFRTPLDSFTLADALAELLESETTGLLHLAGTERTSRLDLGRRLLERAGLDPALAVPAPLASSGDPRPADVSLDVSRARSLLATPLLDLEAGLDRVLPRPQSR